MKISRPFVAAAAAVGLSASAVGTPAALAAAPKAAKTQATKAYPKWAASSIPKVTQSTVDSAAVDALKKMSKYLMSLNTLQIKSDASIDMVTGDGQRIQFDGTTEYKVKRPGFVIHFVSDAKSRDFYYDGKQFTMYAPKLGYYATVAAPATNREVLDTIYDKYGIRLPLEDLFRWNDVGNDRAKNFKSAMVLGPATLDGVKTTHYAFREQDVDWEVWIQDGDQPLPRKLSIVDRTDAARPTFTARLSWTVNPTFADSDFTFVPGADSKKIQLATFKGQ
ncbi:MAG TPA: DUF2092 domain-containing protein [Sphingomicrobium sp.]|nr:DUF2092 domain-containing protein [Sphingomicrobium sp.]